MTRRRRYLTELSLVRLREARRREEEDQRLPSSLCEEVRQRNRLDRLRRACRQGSRIVVTRSLSLITN